MSDYKYIFGTLRTEVIIQEIPMFGVFMDMQMNYGGQFQGTFQLDQTGKDNKTLLDACTPGKTWVACERNGIPIWVGFIWSRVYSAQSKTVQLFAMSFEHYARKRLLTKDYDVTKEQRNIFQDFWTDIQASTGGNLNINVPGTFPTAVSKTYTSLYTDFKYANEAMSEIADAADGFDWYIATSKSGNYYQKNLRIGWPTLGAQSSNSNIVFEFPGNITQYYLTEPMIDAGTHIFVLGAGEGSDMKLGTYENNTYITTYGWPRWDTTVSRKDINSQSAIDSYAEQLGIIRRPPMAVIKLSIKANLEPVFGSYNLGDNCKIIITDPRNPNTLTLNKRLLKWELKPPSSEEVEEANLIFEGDPDV